MLTPIQGTAIANAPTIITLEQCAFSVLDDMVCQRGIFMRGGVQNYLVLVLGFYNLRWLHSSFGRIGPGSLP